MDQKPAKGLKVRVDATREAIFGAEGVDIRKVSFSNDRSKSGILTGVTLAGFCQVEMPGLDGQSHWYPIDALNGENGEKIIEDQIEMEVEGDDSSEDD